MQQQAQILRGTPIKQVNGIFQYSRDKKINNFLNNLPSGEDMNNSSNMQGMFSVVSSGLPEYQALSEDDLQVIIDYEEEEQRLGNFERIFPLQQNAVHYSKFFEYVRPTNELLVRYLKSLPQGLQSISAIANELEASPQFIDSTRIKR